MSNSFVRVPPDSTGKRIDNTELTVDGNVVYRQRIALGDGTDNNIASVTSTGQLEVSSASVQSTLNTSIVPLADSATFTGTYELNAFPDVQVSCITDKAGTLYFDFSVDGTNTNTFPTNGFTVSAGIHEFHNAVKGARYFRVRFVNGATGAQTYLRLYTYFGQFRQGNLPLNQSISADADAIITRSVLVGSTDGGTYMNVPVDGSGHLEVALHSPRLPFGSVHTESLTPIFQIDAVYGINASEMESTTGRAIAGATSATATGLNNLFKVSTGTTSYSYATLQSRKRLRYRAGQGVVGRFTALWPARADSAYLIAGLGTAESGFYFGYAHLASAGLTSQEFGIFHVTGGVRSIRTLTVSAHTATAGNVSIVLNTATAVDIALLSGDSITTVANKIAAGTYPGWDAEARGATVIFLANDAAVKSGTYTATGAGVTASFATTLEGVRSTDVFIPKSTWNGDKLDGTGASGVTLDPTKGNVFQIDIQYLGFGSVAFKVEVIPPDGNNADFVTVHTLRIPNTQTTTSVSQPSFPFTMTAYSAGSTTDLSVQTASCSGFVEGGIRLTGPRASFSGTSTAVTTGSYFTLFTIRNDLVHGHAITERANQSIVNILSFGGAHDDTTPIIYYLLKNATLVGTPSFARWSTNSCIYVDTAATTATISDNGQIIQSLPVGAEGSILIPLEDTTTLQPGETLTVAATTVTGTSTYTIATLNTREDQ